jgi:hypothetical protein
MDTRVKPAHDARVADQGCCAISFYSTEAARRIAVSADHGYWWMGSVIARSPQGDEAIQRFATEMDCFASLAMTMITASSDSADALACPERRR